MHCAVFVSMMKLLAESIGVGIYVQSLTILAFRQNIKDMLKSSWEVLICASVVVCYGI